MTGSECFELSKPGCSKQTRQDDGPVAAMEWRKQVSKLTTIPEQQGWEKKGEPMKERTT